MGAPKLLKALEIVPDDTMDLTATIEAHMPGICEGQSEYSSKWFYKVVLWKINV